MADTNNETSLPQVSLLSDFPHWCRDLALWHHEQWLIDQLLPNDSGQSDHVSPLHAEQDLALREQRLQRHLSAEAFPSTFVAHLDHQPVGSASLVIYDFNQPSVCRHWLTNMYVVPEWRRQGIACLLMHSALRYARDQRIEELRLFTRHHTSYYQRHGWHCVDKGRVQCREVDILSYAMRDVR